MHRRLGRRYEARREEVRRRKVLRSLGASLIEVPLLIRELRRVLAALAWLARPDGELARLVRSGSRLMDRHARPPERDAWIEPRAARGVHHRSH